MKKLLLSLLFLFPAIAFAQMYGGGHFSRVASGDSATYVNSSTVAAYHSAGYADIWFSDASNLWYVWDGSAYVNWDPTASGSGSGGVNTFAPNVQTGNYTLQDIDTIRVTVMNSVSAQNLTIPAGLKQGSEFQIKQDSTGTTTLVLDGVSVGGNSSGTLTLTQDEPVVVYYDDVDRVTIFKGAPATDVFVELDSLTDGSSIAITDRNHYLDTSQATVTFSLSNGPYNERNLLVRMSTTTATWTFPSGAKCVFNGVATGTNSASVVTVDDALVHVLIRTWTSGVYTVYIKNTEPE